MCIPVSSGVPKEKRVWHTQCIVGTAKDDENNDFFVCLQSWKGSILTFIPAMSYEEIMLLSTKHKELRIPKAEEIDLNICHEILVPKYFKTDHAPSQKEFTANKMSGMLIPPMHTGYFPPRPFT